MNLRDEQVELVINNLNPGQVDLLRIEGLAQTTKADTVFKKSLNVAKTKLACNCAFSLKALKGEPGVPPFTIEHLDVRSVAPEGQQTGLTKEDWTQFPNLRQLGADPSFILESASNPNIRLLTVYGNEIGDLARIENGRTQFARILTQVPSAKRVKFEIDPRDTTDFQKLLDEVNSQQGAGKWFISYQTKDRISIEKIQSTT